MTTAHSDDAELDTPLASINKFVIAGWTGRNPESVRRHIEELQAIGVKPPSTVPVFYEVSPLMVAAHAEIAVVGPETSGEVEFVLVRTAAGMVVTVGSDHTDRWLEAVSVHHSKQGCGKPVAGRGWLLQAVAPHWDQLLLRAYSTRGGRRRLYQEGSVAAMLAPTDLLERYRQSGGDFAVGTAMSCGTLALKDGIEYGEVFDIELEDPVRKRSLRHRYRIRTIAIAS
jgi:Protein of unknown function (DUF2848)